jgi:hypothetical protein
MNPDADTSFDKRYILSDEQRDYYTHRRHSAQTCVMMPTLLKFAPDVDTDKLADAFRQTVNAHPFLKANFQVIDGEPYWKKQDDAEVTPVNIRHVSKNEFTDILDDLINRKEFHPDLIKDTLYFAEIFITRNAVYLLMAFHHIYYDGVTRNILIENILTAYCGSKIQKDKGRGIEEGNEELSYRNSESFFRTEKFYDNLFRHYSGPLRLSPSLNKSFVSNLPFYALLKTIYLHIMPSEQISEKHEAKTVDAFVDGNRLRKFCADQKISPNILFLTGLCCAVYQFSGNEYLFFSTGTAGRAGRELNNEVGLFVRGFPLGIKIDRLLPPLELLLSVKEQYYHILKNHSAYTVGRAAEKFGFRHHFNYLFQADTYAVKPILPQLPYDDLTNLVTSKIFSSTKITFDCDVQIYNFDLLQHRNYDRYMINVRYDAALYPKSLMKCFAAAIRNAIEKLY